MAASKPSLELPILLPPIEDELDQCVERLQEQLKQHEGIEAVHLRFQGGQALLCLHYDPDHVTLERVKHLTTRAGASVIERYQRETLRVTSMDRADCAASIEHILQRVPGVLVAKCCIPQRHELNLNQGLEPKQVRSTHRFITRE